MSDKTIFRVASRHKPYSQIGNAMIRDKHLSYEARGVLCFILSYPEDWEFNLTWLMRDGDIGRDRARRIIRELITCGYCRRVRMRNKDGTLGAYEHVFTDEPQDVVSPCPEKASVVAETTDWKPVTGEPALDKPHSITKTDHPKTVTKRLASLDSRDDDRDVVIPDWALDEVRALEPEELDRLVAVYLRWDGSRRAVNVGRAFVQWAKTMLAKGEGGRLSSPGDWAKVYAMAGISPEEAHRGVALPSAVDLRARRARPVVEAA